MTDAPPKTHSDQIEKEMKARKEADKPNRDNRVLIFILSFVVIAGLGAAFLITTNQNIGTDDESPLSGLPAAFAAQLEPLQERLEKDPADVQAMIDIGFLYFDSRAYREAIANFENATKTDAKNVEAIVGLGMAYQAVGRRDDAGPLYDRALKIEPDNAFATIQKAYSLSADDKDQQALTLLQTLEAATDDAQTRSSLTAAIDEIEKKLAN